MNPQNPRPAPAAVCIDRRVFRFAGGLVLVSPLLSRLHGLDRRWLAAGRR